MPPPADAVYRCSQGHSWSIKAGDKSVCPTCRRRPRAVDVPVGSDSMAVPLRRLPAVERVAVFRCPSCLKALRPLKPVRVGRTITCPACQARFPAPAASAGETFVRLTSDATPSPLPFEAPVRPLKSAVAVPGYTILGEVGRGGMGVVYKARHDKLKRAVALKIMLADAVSPADVRRFETEAEAVAHIQHPNILQIYETGKHDGRPYLALEYVGGGTLKRKFEGGQQPILAAAQLIEILARALHAAHLKGVVHRDLKPANILLAPCLPGDSATGLDYREATGVYGVPKVADFGLAKRIDHDLGATRHGEILGTPMYMAPEQARGQAGEVGPRADVYALGAILYEALTGRPPFAADALHLLFRQVIEKRPADPRSLRARIPRDLEAVCLKCLEKNPKDRYQSALALADDLRRFLSGEATHARPRGTLARCWRWAVRNPVPANLLFTALTLLVVGVVGLPRLAAQLAYDAAAEGAKQQALALQDVWRHYADETTAARAAAGPELPVPATFMLRLQQKFKESKRGGQMEIFSTRPGASAAGRVLTAPQKEALDYLGRNPAAGYATPDTARIDGQDVPVVRWNQPILFQESCKRCHHDRDKYPELVKGESDDWRAGELRGVMVIVRPLENDQQATDASLLRTLLWAGGAAAGLLLVCGLILRLGRPRV